jgi:uncharacterized membrane protein YsdA (DUF1294 family)
MKLLYLIIIAVNFSGFLLMGYDKQMARRNWRRIPEIEMFMIALIGGATGIFIGMKYFKHKTKHYSFSVGIPLIMVLNFTIIALLLQII